MENREWGGQTVGVLDVVLAGAIATAWVLLVRAGPLSLPYFWDEADVYVPGALWLARNGFDPTPGTFPDDWSRGHPPLFFLIGALTFGLMGPEPPAGHLVVLPFTILALAGTYLLGTTMFGRRAGIAASLCLAATPLLLSIGGMMLPEAPLAALTVLVLLFLARGSIVGVAVAGSALVLLKETGVFTSLAVTAGMIWDAWRCRRLGERDTWARALVSLVPLAVLVAFFAWQKVEAGYFVFPHHQALLAGRHFGPGNLLTVWPSLVVWHGRWLVVGCALLSSVALLRRRRTSQEPAKPVVAAGSSPGWPLRPSSIAVVMLLLVAANAVFFSKMFWLERYALPAHPGIVILCCGMLLGGLSDGWMPSGRIWLVVRSLPVAAALALGLVGMRSATGPDEAELTFAYADVIETHRQAFHAIGDRLSGDPVVLTSWPMTVELGKPYLGYVERPVRAIHVEWLDDGGKTIDAVLLAEGSRHAARLRDEARSRGMALRGTFRSGSAQALELWSR